MHNPILQSELQRLVSPQFPNVAGRMPPPTCQLYLTLQSDFVHIDAEANHLHIFERGACGSPWHLCHK
jgi:hypothetical protein